MRSMNTSTISTFAQLQLIEPLLRALTKSGYTTPTPIQIQAIPPLIEGHDLLACAQTGTGKTAAFALPILKKLHDNPKKLQPMKPRVLILTPTRELAVQIDESFRTYGEFIALKTAVVFGGVGQAPQVKALSFGVDVLVATPGRLLDLIQQRYIKLDSLEIFVLDEADRMLDMGFIHAINKVISLLPPKRQSLFFSATMPGPILKIASKLLTNPVTVEVTPVSSTVEMIQQSVMYVDKEKKRELLLFILKNQELNKVIVFTRTKHGANKVAEVLKKNGITADAIHGLKSQSGRQIALQNFKTGRSRVLVATDIASRGIDIDDISHVINFEIPHVAESYVHRIGRTARAGAKGAAISFCDADEKSLIRDIEKTIGKEIPVNSSNPFHSTKVDEARFLSKGKAKAAIEGQRQNPRGHKGRSQR